MKKLELLSIFIVVSFFFLLGLYWRHKEKKADTQERQSECETNAALCYVIGIFFFIVIPIFFLLMKICSMNAH